MADPRIERFDIAIERHEKKGNDRMAMHAYRMKLRRLGWKLRKGSESAAVSKYTPHQGKRECARRRRQRGIA